MRRPADCRFPLAFLLGGLLTGLWGTALQADTYSLQLTADRPEAIYKLNEKAKFQIAVKHGEATVANPEVRCIVDDFVTGREITTTESSLTVTGDKPGFIRCQATYRTPEGKTLKATAAVGFAPEKIGLSVPTPDDFDAFWASQKAELAKTPMTVQQTPVNQQDSAIEVFDVQVRCAGAPVSGYLAKPKGAASKSLPAILWVHGAGVRSSSLGNAMQGARAGMLSMDINAHGLPNGKPSEFYAEKNANELKGYRHAGRESRDTIYFRGMYLRLVRAIDFLTSQPEWDGEIVAVIGHSQGGGQALAAGGLDPRVTFVASGVPALCDHTGVAVGRVNGWPKIVPSDDDGKPNAKVLFASRYIDAVNFASRCKAEAILSVGFIDAVCPPSSCYAAYNALKGSKSIVNEPAMGHAAPPHIKTAFFDAVQTHVARKRSARQAASRIVLDSAIQKKALAVLRAGVRSDEFWPSIHAAEALTLAGHGDEVRRLLEPLLSKEDDDQRKCGLARELVRAGNWQLADVMLTILTKQDPHGHVHAAESLYKVAEIGDGVALRTAMESSNVTLQLMAAGALARCGNPEAMLLLRQLLTSSDANTRRLAAWLVGRIGDASDVPQLKKNLAATEDLMERCYHEHSLAALGDPQGLATLTRNLTHDDPAVRTYAATFAGDARAVAAKPQLIKLLDDETLDVRIRAAQSLLVMSLEPPASRQEFSELVYPATQNNPRYSEGAILRLKDDSLLFAVTEFVGRSDFAKARLVARKSRDLGRTWSEPRVLQETTGKMNVMSVSLVRLDPDRIGMFYLQKNGFNDLRVYLRISSDEAATFGEPIRVTTEPGYHVMNNDRVVKLRNGRLLAPVASTKDVRKENHFVSYCWISDDGGATWRKGRGSVDAPKRGAMEPEVVELSDDRLLMIVRTQLGHIAASYSEDGGDTWSKPQRFSTLAAPEAPATLRRISSTGDLLLVWNNVYQAGTGHGGRRTPLTAAVSSDEGKTWSHIRNLETDSTKTYAYCSLIFVKEVALMSYYEEASGSVSTRFRSVPIRTFYEER